MKLSALVALPVLDEKGRTLGRVHEIRAIDGRIAELVYGSAGYIERLTGKAKSTSVPWSRVDCIGAAGIKLK